MLLSLLNIGIYYYLQWLGITCQNYDAESVTVDVIRYPLIVMRCWRRECQSVLHDWKPEKCVWILR